MSMVELLNSDEFAKVERCLRDAVDCAAQRVGAGSGQRSGAWTDNGGMVLKKAKIKVGGRGVRGCPNLVVSII